MEEHGMQRKPLQNLKMIIDTLLTKSMEQPERAEFLKSIRGQVDKLDFLIQALVKTSRLETSHPIRKRRRIPV